MHKELEHGGTQTGWTVLSREFVTMYRDLWLRLAGYGLAIGTGLGEYLIHH